MQDEAQLKCLNAAEGLVDQGYEDKAKRILARFEFDVPNPLSSLDALKEKVKVRIEKAKAAKARYEMSFDKSQGGNQAEPEAKKRRREDLTTDEERRNWDSWIEDLKKKR